MVRYNKMKRYACIDIGGTAIKYGIIGGDGHIFSRREMQTEAWRGGQSILDRVLSIVKECRRTGEISGVCISTAGVVDIEKGEIIHSAALIPDYRGICFKKAVWDRFRLPCEVENDVNCAGLAETVSGSARGSSSVFMLTVGTGIGGCFVLDKKVFRGAAGSACEVGYMHMRGSDFQTLGAASILTKKVTERKGASFREWNGFRIFQEAEKGDAVCIQAIDEMVDVLGAGIANICYVLNPQTVVLGGGVMTQKEYLGEKIQAAVERWLIPSVAQHTSLCFAQHGNAAGMLGAFYHFISMTKKGVNEKNHDRD